VAWTNNSSSSSSGGGGVIRFSEGAVLTPSGGSITPTDAFHHVAAGTISAIATTNFDGNSISFLLLEADGAVTLTPTLRLRTPVTDYENKGYAAAGMGLREGALGFTLGRYGLGVEDLVLQLGYAFTYVQKYDGGGADTEQYRVNRSDADFSLAYIFNEKFVVAAGLAYRLTHDGFELEDYPSLAPGAPLLLHHDPVLAATYLAPTAVANYQLTPEFSLSGRFAMIVWGDSVSNAMTFGLSAGYSMNLASGE